MAITNILCEPTIFKRSRQTYKRTKYGQQIRILARRPKGVKIRERIGSEIRPFSTPLTSFTEARTGRSPLAPLPPANVDINPDCKALLQGRGGATCYYSSDNPWDTPKPSRWKSGRVAMDLLWKSGANTGTCQTGRRQEKLKEKRLQLCKQSTVTFSVRATKIEMGDVGLIAGCTINHKKITILIHNDSNSFGTPAASKQALLLSHLANENL